MNWALEMFFGIELGMNFAMGLVMYCKMEPGRVVNGSLERICFVEILYWILHLPQKIHPH